MVEKKWLKKLLYKHKIQRKVAHSNCRGISATREQTKGRQHATNRKNTKIKTKTKNKENNLLSSSVWRLIMKLVNY